MNAASFSPSFGLYVSVSALILSSLHCVHLCYRNKPILPLTLLFFLRPFFSSLDNFSLHPLIFFHFSPCYLKKKKKSPSCGIVLKTVDYCMWGKNKRSKEGVEKGRSGAGSLAWGRKGEKIAELHSVPKQG